MQMDFEFYASLFGLNTKRSKLMEELYDVVRQIETLSGELQDVYAFGMLAVKCSKEEQMLAIGDPDDFYEDIMQVNIDYRDLLVFNINKMALVCGKLQNNLKGVIDKNNLTTWGFVAHRLENLIKGYEIRDVFAEQERQLEKEMEEDK